MFNINALDYTFNITAEIPKELSEPEIISRDKFARECHERRRTKKIAIISMTIVMSVDSYHHVRHEVIFQIVASDRHPARPIGWRRRILCYDTDDVDGVVGVRTVSFRGR